MTSQKKILVKGPALSQSGYGEQTRFALRALRAFPDKFDVYIQNTVWGKTGWIWADTEERRWIDSMLQKTVSYVQKGGGFDLSLQVLTPLEFERICNVNVGYTAGIETDKIAKEWINPSQAMDRILVTSEHAKKGLVESVYDALDQNNQPVKARISVPVLPVSYPVRQVEPATTEVEQNLHLPYDFNFLVVAQWGVRKNIEATIKGFVEEFQDKEVGLVLKTSTMSNSLLDKQLTKTRVEQLLSEYEDRVCKVHLVHGDMTEGEMTALYQHPKIKALVAISHGEGFGLPIFEAAYLGLPVITTEWGGQCDFLYVPGKKDKKPEFMATKVEHELKPIQPQAVWDKMLIAESKWAYPKEWRYKVALRKVFKNYNEARSKAKRLQKHVLKEFGASKKYKAFVDNLLEQDVPYTPEVKLEDMPKVSVMTSIFKGDDFINEYFADMEKQTLFQAGKVELLLINANSPGNEEPVCLAFQEKYPEQVVYKKLDEDPGIYGVWNMAVEMSTGEYLTNANLDDRKSPDCLEQLARRLVVMSEVGLVYADNFVTGYPNETFEKNSANGAMWLTEGFSLQGMFRGNLPHCMPMWRKSLHEEHGMFNQEYKSAGDWDFFLRCAIQGVQLHKVNETLGLYFFNPQGMSTNPEHAQWKQAEEKKVFETNKALYIAKQEEEEQKQKMAMSSLGEHGIVL